MTHFTKHLEDLKSRLRTAAAAAGRSETDVSILAVSKRHNVDAIHKAFNSGLLSMGENYVQEALTKMPLCNKAIEWHYIGRIQANKTRLIAGNFSWVQTVTEARIAKRLSDQRPAEMAPLNVCVQVCADGHTKHGGVMPADAEALCAEICALPNLRLRGLMTIPAPSSGLASQRVPFSVLRKLGAELQNKGYILDTLSMGMTNDLEAAVLEGSTMLRIGTALFGTRPD